jgi:hypothetical protein
MSVVPAAALFCMRPKAEEWPPTRGANFCREHLQQCAPIIWVAAR